MLNALILTNLAIEHGSFIGDPPIKGPLPGTKTRKERLESAVTNVEKSWIIKIIIIVAAITGVVIFGLEVWRLMRH